MGHNDAWDALTTPKPTEHQKLIVFIAQCCMRRFAHRTKGHAEDVSYVLAVLLRWRFISNSDMRSISRDAYGRLISDVMSAWDILLGREVPTHGATDKPPYVAKTKSKTANS